MTTSLRRQPDLAKHAVALASAYGWTILGSCEAGDARAGDDPSVRQAVVVAGGDLQEAALLIVVAGLSGESGRIEGEPPPVDSEHFPRRLLVPAIRRVRGIAIAAALIEYPSRGTLDSLLSRGAELAVGEAVTVLSSVARGLANMHAAGWAGASLAPTDVAFRGDGCPVLTGASGARMIDAALARADTEAFALLARTVCAAVRGVDGAVLLAAATASQHRSWNDVVSAVLRSADPTAVYLPLPSAAVDRPGQGGKESQQSRVLGIVERGLDIVGGHPIARGLAATRGWIGRRPTLILIGAVPVVAVLLVLLVLPEPQAENRGAGIGHLTSSAAVVSWWRCDPGQLAGTPTHIPG